MSFYRVQFLLKVYSLDVTLLNVVTPSLQNSKKKVILVQILISINSEKPGEKQVSLLENLDNLFKSSLHVQHMKPHFAVRILVEC